MGFNGSKCKFYGSADEARKEIEEDRKRNKTIISSDRAIHDF